MDAAANLSDTMKVGKSRIFSKYKRECTVSSVTLRKVDYAVVITNIPSSTCPYFQLINLKLLFKHIIFIIVLFLSERNIGDELKERHITKDKVKILFQGAGEEVPEKFFQTKSGKKSSGPEFKESYKVILTQTKSRLGTPI